MRCIVMFMIILVVGGCAPLGGSVTIHPHSEVNLPTFCLYLQSLRSQNSKRIQNSNPIPIQRLEVYQYVKVNDEKFQWKTFDQQPPSDIKAWVKWIKQRPTSGKQELMWYVLYLPDPILQPLKPFSCITYGKLPPGYRERAPALPLIPERLSYVSLRSMESGHGNDVFFIIRADESGKPVKLEYRGDLDSVQVIPLP